MLIISGTSNKELSLLIAKKLNKNIVDCDLSKFNNGETNVKINETIRGKDVFIIQTGYNNNINVNDIIMETILLIDACKRSSSKSITLIMACYPYARQDRKDSSRVPISAKVVANMLYHTGISRIVSIDLHASQIQGFIDCPIDNLYSVKLVYDKLDKLYNISNKNERDKYIMISPDAGAAKRTEKFAKILEMNLCIMHKTRDYSQPGIIQKNILVCEHDIDFTNKIAIITDDILDSGNTFIKACETLITKGFSKVIGVITHGYFTGDAIDKINSCNAIEKIIVSNSISQLDNLKKCNKIELIDISDQLVDAISIINNGGSMSNLF